jgi:hypothetical protein
MKTKNGKFAQRLLGSAVVGLALLALPERAEAQEILLTGPLAGAPAVRKLRLYREGRFEFAPAVTFTLLDEYQRTILLGARLQYNFTDWLGIGAWGAYGGLLQLPTALTENVQEQNEIRRRPDGNPIERRLTALNLGPNFEDQLGGMDWVVAPQITAVPFRGKLALFQSVYLDTDLYFFGGPAFVGLTERGNCEAACANLQGDFPTATRMAIAPTFGLGFTFYAAKWAGIGFEWRGLPFAWNSGGFDTAGGGKDQEFPDNKITDADQQFRFNQLLTVSFNIYLPTQFRISE